MIEFIETYNNHGMMRVRLEADGLPTAWACDDQDYSYIITVFPGGRAMAKSRSCGNGSVRYHHFNSYEEAQAHAIAWAKRKQAEERKRVALNAKAMAELQPA